MHLMIAVLALMLALAGPASVAAAQGYYQDGYYYTNDPYWPQNNETAYDYGVYAYAPGFGPYLRLGGESGWNPNIGTTYNSYPPGNYYTDYGLPYVGFAAVPYAGRVYGGWRGYYGAVPYCWPGYLVCR